jgi:hypothetical protein
MIDGTTRNPFTPGLPINPKQFVGRKEEIRLFEQSLGQAFYGNPQNFAILGDRGIGKSSLLRKFESIAREKNCLVIRRDIDASVDSLQKLAYFILCALKEEGKRFFSKRKKAKTSVSDFFSKYKISVSISGFGGSIERVPSAAIQEDFYNELAEISGNIQAQVPVTVIMLDEAEHIQNIKGAWGFIRSVFTRLLENDYHFYIIVCGKLGLFRNIKEIFSPMERFFFPRKISLLKANETIEAIEKPMKNNGISITEEVKKSLVEYTDGHPFIIQVFGFYLFELGERIIDAKLFQKELPNIFERLKIQVFSDRYNSASPQELKILNFMALSEVNVFKPAEIQKSLKIKNVKNLLRRLVKKDCLRKVGRGEYTVFHKLFKLYIRSID